MITRSIRRAFAHAIATATTAAALVAVPAVAHATTQHDDRSVPAEALAAVGGALPLPLLWLGGGLLLLGGLAAYVANSRRNDAPVANATG